jgi:hypothetical protein
MSVLAEKVAASKKKKKEEEEEKRTDEDSRLVYFLKRIRTNRRKKKRRRKKLTKLNLGCDFWLVEPTVSSDASSQLHTHWHGQENILSVSDLEVDFFEIHVHRLNGELVKNNVETTNNDVDSLAPDLTTTGNEHWNWEGILNGATWQGVNQSYKTIIMIKIMIKIIMIKIMIEFSIYY